MQYHRRLSVGNFYGGRKLLNQYKQNPCINCKEVACEKFCIRRKFDSAVNIKEINANLMK